MTGRSNRLESVRARLGRAVDRSLLVRGTRRVETKLSRWFRGSRIVRWFIAEPEPEVIVIDLRETYTVGPVLRGLDRVSRSASRLGERTGAIAAISRAGSRVVAEPLRVTGYLLLVVALGGLTAALASNGSIGGWLILFGLALLATRERRSASELADTRVGAALIAAFEPPEPPDERD